MALEQAPQPFARSRVERLIASVRIALAAASLVGVWLETGLPTQPSTLTSLLYGGYLVYALALAAIMWRRDSRGRLPLAIHVVDILIASVLQYVTLGISSAFYTYFVFALFSAAMRWGWQATIRTAAVVLPLFLMMSAVLNTTLGPAGFDPSRFVIRAAYLVVVTIVLVFLGQHEARLREEIRRLAQWPLPSARDWNDNVRDILEYGAGIVGAGDIILFWSEDDEPWLYVASALAADGRIERYPPNAYDPIVPADLADATFIGAPPVDPIMTLRVARGGKIATRVGLPVHPDLAVRLGRGPVASAAFRTGHLTGRVFFVGMPEPSAEMLPLVELVGREIGASLDRLHNYRRSRDLAIVEERIRVARDLHDGILQSLTGIRLELQHVAARRRDATQLPEADARLGDLETAIATEQRELRRLIDDLRPSAGSQPEPPLAERLQSLRSRIALEWSVPVSITVTPVDLEVPPPFERALPYMVHEAIVNAMKHGRPSRVSVAIHRADGVLRITVDDDGQGFAFTGVRDHAALTADNVGPRSLRERVTSLGGRIEVESHAAGSRVELSIPLRPVHA